uniref:Uncharacterized protein n=1 Tax=viral metagenome TaxID=1070528 RepID=A0A6M3MB50_9ZZZZ
MNGLYLHKLSPLSIHLGRYSDKYMNKAKIDALYWRIKCYDCGKPIFEYDPDDENYIKCKCGARKRTPNSWSDFTPEWGDDQRRRDGFAYLFGDQTSRVTENV